MRATALMLRRYLGSCATRHLAAMAPPAASEGRTHARRPPRPPRPLGFELHAGAHAGALQLDPVLATLHPVAFRSIPDVFRVLTVHEPRTSLKARASVIVENELETGEAGAV